MNCLPSRAGCGAGTPRRAAIADRLFGHARGGRVGEEWGPPAPASGAFPVVLLARLSESTWSGRRPRSARGGCLRARRRWRRRGPRRPRQGAPPRSIWAAAARGRRLRLQSSSAVWGRILLLCSILPPHTHTPPPPPVSPCRSRQRGGNPPQPHSGGGRAGRPRELRRASGRRRRTRGSGPPERRGRGCAEGLLRAQDRRGQPIFLFRRPLLFSRRLFPSYPPLPPLCTSTSIDGPDGALWRAAARYARTCSTRAR